MKEEREGERGDQDKGLFLLAGIWTWDVPKDIWCEGVVPSVSVSAGCLQEMSGSQGLSPRSQCSERIGTDGVWGSGRN